MVLQSTHPRATNPSQHSLTIALLGTLQLGIHVVDDGFEEIPWKFCTAVLVNSSANLHSPHTSSKTDQLRDVWLSNSVVVCIRGLGEVPQLLYHRGGDPRRLGKVVEHLNWRAVFPIST